MGLFDKTLHADESLFLDTMPLDADFMPPVIKFRENEQQYIADCIKPLFNKRSGKKLQASHQKISRKNNVFRKKS